jgi:hypothetical protein
MRQNIIEIEKAINATKALNELSESGKDLFFATRATAREVATAKILWLEGNKSKLIKIGVAFMVFPDPTPVTPIVGASLIAAGLFQKGVKKRALYVGDIKKTFERTLREVQLAKQSLNGRDDFKI